MCERICCVRLSELADRSRVSSATIKYYLREGLLPPGERRSSRTSDYGEQHLVRLRLLRALREVGDVPVSRLRRVVDAIEDESTSLPRGLIEALDATAVEPLSPGPHHAQATALVTQVISDAGWHDVRPEAPRRAILIGVVERLLDLHPEFAQPERLLWYAEQAAALVRVEGQRAREARLALPPDRVATLSRSIVGGVVNGELFLTMRLLAAEQISLDISRQSPAPPDA